MSVSFSAWADTASSAVAKQLEAANSTDIGFALMDYTGTEIMSYRSNERFPMNSTFKAIACAALLKAHETGAVDYKRRATIPADLVPWSPVTKDIVGETRSFDQLCAIALKTSDNTAANLVVNALGGPWAITGFFRQIDDDTSRLDRLEPMVNEALKDDPRDTTTPSAMAATLSTVLRGDVLSKHHQSLLANWMSNTVVADRMVRSVLPDGWEISDRTGGGRRGSRGIIAAITPPGSSPYFLAIYLKENKLSMASRDSIIARIADEMIHHIQGIER